jgi:hypothetical protein
MTRPQPYERESSILTSYKGRPFSMPGLSRNRAGRSRSKGRELT